jgi:two-component system response regulator RegX3
MADSILIADDDPDVLMFLRTCLEEEGYNVIEAINGGEALEKFKSLNPSLAILDVSMGHPDGIEVCRLIRQSSKMPIIMLTDRGTEIDEAMCLTIGADDFIAKPCTARVLNLRVSTQLRHKSWRQEVELHALVAGPLRLNLDSREFMVTSELVSLTKIEFDFLQLLMQNPLKVYSRQEITESIGGSFEYSSDKLLDAHASRIRAKIRLAGGPESIVATRGIGYRLL